MREHHSERGWRGAALVAITYVYFLIFAQFGFLARLGQLGLSGSSLKLIMASMAAGGMLLSLLAPRAGIAVDPAKRLRTGFAVCGAAAVLSLLPLTLAFAMALAFLIGAGLGLLTVTLVTNLRAWTGDRAGIVMAGAGTGLGYFICNFPPLFTATPQVQAGVSAALCGVGLSLPLGAAAASAARGSSRPSSFSFWRALTAFTALVWLDSAAFYIIQHTPALKAGTWMGSAHLWINAWIHLAFALLAGWLLQRRRVDLVLSAGLLALAFACVLLHNPALVMSASLFYPAGVSLYSVALVAYPAFLTPASSLQDRGRQAGWIYAVAGWMGSALGIGMGQNLGHVPLAFVAAAGTVVLIPAAVHLTQVRTREVALLCAALALAFALYRLLPRPVPVSQLSEVARGRQVYVGEGCIHCHSQYVRPNSADVLMWGPVEPLNRLMDQHPPLIGNRRQGPDLAEVGARRSRLWLKAHLIDPGEVSGGSIMPSYAFLFHDERGDDLVDYLASLGAADVQRHWAEVSSWSPSTESLEKADPQEGEQLYQRLCATCHSSSGATRQRWSAEWQQMPADLFIGPYRYVQPSASPAVRITQVARITKFGIPATDMPGHEYLSDRQIASISKWLVEHSAHALRPS